MEKACARLRLSEAEADPDFGLVSIDPDKDLYAILVPEEIAERLERGGGVEGSFSNPKIEPFGPPKGRSGSADS